MDQRHRNTIRDHLVELTENLLVEGKLIQSLDRDRIFSGHIKDTILCESTNFAKASKLLELLPKRGPKAFPAFIKALLISDQEWLAELLDPYLTEQIRSTLPVSSTTSQQSGVKKKDDPLPEMWVDPAHQLLEVQVRKVDPHMQPEMRNLFEESRGHQGMSGNPLIPYKMDTKPRGRVLIIDNSKFLYKRAECVILGKTYLDDRENTNLDSTSLDLLFTRLGFTVDKKENLTAQEMLSAVEGEAQRKDHKNASAFIMVLSSHGTESGIFSRDNVAVPIEDLVTPFNAKNCKGLAGKPKMIFIQACQGTKDDLGSEVSDSGTTTDEQLQEERGQGDKPQKSKSHDGDKAVGEKYLDEITEGFQDLHVGNAQPSDTADAHKVAELIGTDSDIYIHEATTKGYKSWRNTKRGSWFLQAISWVFQRYAYKEDLLSMMTMVNQLVSRGKVVDENQGSILSLQVANAGKNTLKKKVYFFPGLPVHSSPST